MATSCVSLHCFLIVLTMPRQFFAVMKAENSAEIGNSKGYRKAAVKRNGLKRYFALDSKSWHIHTHALGSQMNSGKTSIRASSFLGDGAGTRLSVFTLSCRCQ